MSTSLLLLNVGSRIPNPNDVEGISRGKKVTCRVVSAVQLYAVNGVRGLRSDISIFPAL